VESSGENGNRVSDAESVAASSTTTATATTTTKLIQQQQSAGHIVTVADILIRL